MKDIVDAPHLHYSGNWEERDAIVQQRQFAPFQGCLSYCPIYLLTSRGRVVTLQQTGYYMAQLASRTRTALSIHMLSYLSDISGIDVCETRYAGDVTPRSSILQFPDLRAIIDYLYYLPKSSVP